MLDTSFIDDFIDIMEQIFIIRIIINTMQINFTQQKKQHKRNRLGQVSSFAGKVNKHANFRYLDIELIIKSVFYFCKFMNIDMSTPMK